MSSELLKDKKFLKNIGKLFGASFVSQLIPFIVLPFLTRMYSPDDFGFWAYFLSLSGILSIFMTGNYEFAIVLPKEEKEAVNLASGSIILTTFVFLLCLPASLILSTPILKNAGIQSNDHSFVLLICLMALFMALFRIMNYWNNRKNRFHTTAIGSITRSVSGSTIQLISGLNPMRDYMGLISGSIFGYFAGTAVQSKNFVSAVVKNKKKINVRSIRESLIRYKDFPKYFMPSEFMNYLSSNVPVIFLTNMFSSAAAGLYSIPQKFINTPLTMLGSSISQVYYKKATDLRNSNEDISKITTDIYKKLFVLGILPLSIVAGYGDYIFSIFLGEKWEVSGLYAALLAPWMLMVFASSPISIVFATLEKQKTSLKLNFYLLLLRLAAFTVGGIVFKSAFIAVMLYGASGFVYWLYLSFFIIKTVGGDKKGIMKFTLVRLCLIMLPIIISRMVFEWIM